MIRAFVAIELPPPLKGFLAELGGRLLQEVPSGTLQRVRPDGIHLTLKFLGPIPESRLPQIDSQLEVWLRHQPGFQVQVGGLGCFPNLLHPRVVWVGARSPGGELDQLQREIDQRLSIIGFSAEDRPFSGHLTLGRVRPSVRGDQLKQIGSTVGRMEETEHKSLEVGGVCLFQSDLRPTGAVYTRLREWRLRDLG